ncbi:hypothetical protein [Pseudomonas cremoricolorata]|uniref:Lipoprotein n=1 Tax=Pseudomonas cremoricolorata TaxID=157783 RepID=A0A089WX95_9PSED|nr:hypothetical protein [Pseudomonas cremoricolorata]AIR91237.1 hypothetical protein LK03_19065 [Pseudomonas cremoricolorata]
MSFRSSALIATFAALSSMAVMAGEDIAGVSLGASLAQAKQAVTTANEDYIISPLLGEGMREVGVKAVTEVHMPGLGLSDDGGPSDEFLALTDKSEKIWFASRVQRLPDGERINKQTLEAALVEKFGKPSTIVPLSGTHYFWMYDRSGKQYFGNTPQGPCPGIMGNGNTTGFNGMTIRYPHQFRAECGKRIEAHFSGMDANMISMYKLSITDYKAMYDQITGEEAQAKAAQEQQLSDEKAKDNKPKL